VAQELPTHAPLEASSGTLTVHAGDTLSSLARRHGVRIEDLLRWNGLSRSATLHLGQRLRLTANEQGLGGATTAAAAPAIP
jgi:LysM repeat protein